MTDLIGSGKIVGLIEFSSEYFYNPDSYVRKIGPLFSVVQIQKPSFTLIPSGGWSGAGKQLIRLAQKPAPTVAKTVRTFNKPIESLKKLGQGYCLDTSFMLMEGDSKSLTKAFTYAPRKVLRLALWGATRKTTIGKVGGMGIACAVGGYEIYRLVYPTDPTMASMLMLEPLYSKAQSEHISKDPRLPHVKKYKSDKQKVMGFLQELAAQKAELVDKTPFDSFENQLAYGIIDKKLAEIYDLIRNNSDITKEYVNQALEPVQDSLEELHKKVDTLLTKNKVNREILPLRDPIDINLFPLFFTNAGTKCQRQKDLKQAQLRVAYTLLYHTGLRVNEIRQITKKQIEDAIKASQISVIHHKTRQPYIHVLSITAVHNFKRLKPEMEIIFNKYQFKYLFGKDEPMHKKSLIRTINEDLKNTCKLNQIPFNIKSHSFRINMVSSLLKNTSVQKAAQVIGHKNINSTMAYQRYAIQKDEIRILLDKIEGNQQE